MGETVQVGVPAGADVVYIEHVEGQRALRYLDRNSRPLTAAPVECRQGAGRVRGQSLAEARLRAGLPPSTGYTIVVPELLALLELAPSPREHV